MFATTINIFVDLVFFSFLNILILQLNEKRYIDFGLPFYNSLILIAISRLMLLTTLGQKLTNKLKKTGEIIYDLSSNFEDPEIKDEV